MYQQLEEHESQGNISFYPGYIPILKNKNQHYVKFSSA